MACGLRLLVQTMTMAQTDTTASIAITCAVGVFAIALAVHFFSHGLRQMLSA